MKNVTKFFYKTIDILTDIIIIPIIIISAICTFSLFSARNNDEVPTLFGYSAARVLSGSMVSKGFNIGDVVILEQVPIKDLKEGDIIGFYDSVSTIYSSLISPLESNVSGKGSGWLQASVQGKIWTESEGYLTYLNKFKEEEYKNNATVQRIIENYGDYDFVAYNGTEEQKNIASTLKTGEDKEALKVGATSQGATMKRKFHVIERVFQDKVSGKLYFITNGPNSGNLGAPGSVAHDTYYIPEDYVIGRYSEKMAWFSSVIGFCGSLQGIIYLVEVPCGVMLLLLALQLIQQVDEYMQDKARRKFALENPMLKNRVRAVEGRRVIRKKITSRFKIWFNKYLYFDAGDDKMAEVRKVRNAKLNLKKSMQNNFTSSNTTNVNNQN